MDAAGTSNSRRPGRRAAVEAGTSARGGKRASSGKLSGWWRKALEDLRAGCQSLELIRVVAVSQIDERLWILSTLRREFRELFEIVLMPGRRDSHQHAGRSLADIRDVVRHARRDEQVGSGCRADRPLADMPLTVALEQLEGLLLHLARIKLLFVIARNSTFTYKGRAVDVKQVGRELGVRYALEGSVRKAGDSVRVTAQLIDASTGAHLWAERYDRSSEDIFALQNDIALSAVGAASVRKAEIERVRRKRPDSLDAYDLVLQAQPDVDSGVPEQVARALTLMERAIALEPAYALAHGNAAMCHHCLFLRAGLQEVNRAASIRHARSAIVYGQDDALALTFAAFSIGMDAHDRTAAFAALEAALAISPSSALTYILGSVILGWAGEAERAIDWSEQGMRLSPFDSWAWGRV